MFIFYFFFNIFLYIFIIFYKNWKVNFLDSPTDKETPLSMQTHSKHKKMKLLSEDGISILFQLSLSSEWRTEPLGRGSISKKFERF